MGNLTIYLDAATEELLLDRLMNAMRLEGKPLSMSEVVRKHLEYSFKADIKEVITCKQ